MTKKERIIQYELHLSLCRNISHLLNAKNSKKYNINLLNMPPPKSCDENRITIERCDVQDMILNYLSEGDRVHGPLVLNMASNISPGGSVMDGGSGQEECLYHLTNYHSAIENIRYPLYDNTVVYSPVVNVIDENLEYPTISCIAIPAIKKPPVTLDGDIQSFLRERDYILTQKKILALVCIAIKKKHTTLILGAMGCGAYRNPKHTIAQIFYNVLKRYEGYFEKIGFAISDPETFEIFKSVFNH